MDKKSIQEILAQGIKSDFWEYMRRVIEEKITALEQEQRGKTLKGLPANEYKLENELLLAKIDFLKQLQTLPESIIMSLENATEQVQNLDPYVHPKDFEK